MLTRVLARALAPEVRVCGVAPGTVAVESEQEERRGGRGRARPHRLAGRRDRRNPLSHRRALRHRDARSSSTEAVCCKPGGTAMRSPVWMAAAMSIDRPSLPYENEVVSIGGVPHEEPTDGELIERVGNGDRDAFEELYRRYTRPVLGLALRRLGDRGRAEDASSGMRSRAIWRSASSYDPERGRGGAWLYTVARNAIVDGARRRPEPPMEAPDEPSGEGGPDEPRGGVVAHLARACCARAPARARAPGDRARLLGRPLAERDRGIPRRPAGHDQDADPGARSHGSRTCSRTSSMSDRFDELVGEIEDPDGEARLRRVHRLLLSVDPPPEVSSAWRRPLRGRAGAGCRAARRLRLRSDRGCARGGRLRRRLVRERPQRRRRSRGCRSRWSGRHRRRAPPRRSSVLPQDAGGQLADERRRPRAHAEPRPLGLLRALADQGWKARRPVRPLHRATPA